MIDVFCDICLLISEIPMKNRVLLSVFIVFLLLFFIGMGRGCTDPEGARRTLVSSGYTNIEIGGPVWFGGEDPYRTAFRAVGPTGVPVSGMVSGSLFKGNTVRIFN